MLILLFWIVQDNLTVNEFGEENPNLAFAFQELMLNSKFTTFSGKLCPADFLHHEGRGVV